MTEPTDIFTLVKDVEDAQSFRRFVQALILDRQNDQSGSEWQNTTIEAFLEAALAWAESTDWGAAQEPPPQSDWQRFARFLYVGKIYE